MSYQLQEAQQAVNEETMLQYKEWLQEGQKKGLRGLFRSLKVNWYGKGRAGTNAPADEAALAGLGKPLAHQTRQPTPSTSQPPTSCASTGPAAGATDCRTVAQDPERSQWPRCSVHTAVKECLEATAELPTQLQMHVMMMLPKNTNMERPITLTSVLWRVWCRLRKPILDQWQRQLPAPMDHDRRCQCIPCGLRKTASTRSP